MAWCRKATSHYLSQCWPRSMSHMASLGHNELTVAATHSNTVWSHYNSINFLQITYITPWTDRHKIAKQKFCKVQITSEKSLSKWDSVPIFYINIPCRCPKSSHTFKVSHIFPNFWSSCPTFFFLNLPCSSRSIQWRSLRWHQRSQQSTRDEWREWHRRCSGYTESTHPRLYLISSLSAKQINKSG